MKKVIITDYFKDSKIEKLVIQRDEARLAKDWSKADAIRDELDALGVEIQDTSGGTTWNLTD